MPIVVAPEVAYRAVPGQNLGERRDCPVCNGTRRFPPTSGEIVRAVTGPFSKKPPFEAVEQEDYAVAAAMAVAVTEKEGDTCAH